MTKKIQISEEVQNLLQQITFKGSKPSKYDKAHVEATFRVFIPLEELGNINLTDLLKDAIGQQSITEEPEKGGKAYGKQQKGK